MNAFRDDTDDLLGLTDARLAAGFGRRAVGRHRGLAVALFTLGTGVVVTSYVLAPRTYHTEVRLLAQRNLVMPALGNPRRTVPMDSDAPTRLAAETVMRRENLVAVIRATHLKEEWGRSRAPILRLKDRLLRPLIGDPTEEDKLESLIGLLRKKVYVAADEGTVTIGIDWRDAVTACRIVEEIQQNFLEQRHASEVSSIADAISILEGHAATIQGTIESALVEARRATPAPRASSAVRVHDSPPPTRSDPSLVALEVLLAAKGRAIADLEEFRQKRLGQLYADLAEQKNTYGPFHPAIAVTEQSIQALSGESPQIAALKREEGELREAIRQRSGSARAEPARAEPPRAELAATPSPRASDAADDPREPAPESAASYARSRLKSAMAEYEDLLERLEGARIELDTARAAFKYRYGVIAPAQVPKKPSSPSAALFLGTGLALVLGLAVAGAVLADLARGRIVESWQVERFVGLDVVAEVTRP